MNSAKTLLDQGRSQVSEVAYALGYGSASHFISAFKKKYGITPKKYVQQS
jgi:AraC-like DNA-binding protein